MKDFKTIKDIVEQLSMSEYECEGGFLKMNIAFIRLQQIAKLDYQNKFQLNESVIYKDKPYFIRGIRTVSSSHPNADVEYDLSEDFNRPCTSNKSDLMGINEKELLTPSENKTIQIQAAKKLLIDEGIKL